MRNTPTHGEPPERPVIIGLAGGVGAGKSSVATAFRRLGCAVIDSDVEAKAALRLPAVKDQLLAWWGPIVLGADGEIDRGAIARIVFADPGERLRLEGLIHPLLRRTRQAAIDAARAAAAPAVILDAPLLFEAGLDAECDAIVFVDAPRHVRAARVASRGWDEAELDRREKSQLPLEHKRARAHHVVDNSADEARLRARVDEVFSATMSSVRRR